METAYIIKRYSRIFKKYTKSVISRLCSPNMQSCLGQPDEYFLSAFDIADVKNNLQKKNNKAAQKNLIDHYRVRRFPKWPPFPSRMTNVYDLKASELIEEANNLLSLRFLFDGYPEIHFQKKIDWKYNFTSDPKARWARELNRHCWWSILGVAFEKTRDERYVCAFMDIVNDWILRNPPPKIKDETNVAWTLMGVGMRCLIWTSAFGIFLTSKSFSDAAAFKMLQSIYDHANFLCLFQTNNNHLIRESNGLATVGVYFPEFYKSDEWRKTAFDRLENALIEQVNQDGSHFEYSIGYQWLVIEEFEGTLNLLNTAELNFRRIDLSHYLKNMYRFLVYTSRPDGSMPQLNDGFMEGNDRQRYKLAAAGWKFGCRDFLFVAGSGKEGTKPERTSVAFEDAGIYVMRSGWDEKVNYLLCDCGPFGGHHGHEDKLSFELYALGYPFIVDPGTYTYNTADPFRNYFVSSRSHNTLTVENMSQIRRQKAVNLNPAFQKSKPAQWITTKEFDYVQSYYDEGYGEYRFWADLKKDRSSGTEEIVHSRWILFVKPDYWLMHDKVQSSVPLVYEIFFQVSPEVQLEISEQRTVKLFRNGVYLNLIPNSNTSIEIDSFFGSETPIQGWYSNGKRNHKIPAPSIVVKSSRLKKWDITTLLFPTQKESESVDIEIQKNGIVDNETNSYIISSSQGRDFITITSECKQMDANRMAPAKLISIKRSNPIGDCYAKWEWRK